MERRKVGGNFPLESSGSFSMGEKEKRGKGKERKEKKMEREVVPSLRSMEIGMSVFVGARGKVHLRDKSFT